MSWLLRWYASKSIKEGFIIYCSFTGYGVALTSSLEGSQDSEGKGRYNFKFLALWYLAIALNFFLTKNETDIYKPH